jgi:hypothetical protein
LAAFNGFCFFLGLRTIGLAIVVLLNDWSPGSHPGWVGTNES